MHRVSKYLFIYVFLFAFPNTQTDRVEFDAPLPAASTHRAQDGRRHIKAHHRPGARTIPHLRLPRDGVHCSDGLPKPVGKWHLN